MGWKDVLPKCECCSGHGFKFDLGWKREDLFSCVDGKLVFRTGFVQVDRLFDEIVRLAEKRGKLEEEIKLLIKPPGWTSVIDAFPEKVFWKRVEEIENYRDLVYAFHRLTMLAKPQKGRSLALAGAALAALGHYGYPPFDSYRDTKESIRDRATRYAKQYLDVVWKVLPEQPRRMIDRLLELPRNTHAIATYGPFTRPEDYRTMEVPPTPVGTIYSTRRKIIQYLKKHGYSVPGEKKRR